MSPRVLVVANDHVGSRMAGPGIRSLRFATELASEHDVTLVVPFDTDLDVEGVRIVRDDPWDPRRMRDRVGGYDVVVSQKLPVPTMRRLARSEQVAIYDLYTPVTIEALAQGAPRSGGRPPVTHRLNALTQELTLAYGDAFVCASEKQRDLWLGALLTLGRVNQDVYDADPSLRSLVDVVPFGIEPDPPSSAGAVLKGVVPGIGRDDKVLLWGGGIWDWLDPLTVIRAIERLARARDDVRLVFLGLRHPNPRVPQMEMERRALALAEELGIRDRVVFFNEGWVPYEERGAYLLEADIGVSAHFDDLETRFAFRTRLLDYVWAGLPIVATGGDALGDLVRERRLGRTVGFEDVDGWVEAVDVLLDNEGERRAIAARSAGLSVALAWPRAVEPLRQLVDTTRGRPGAVAPAALARYVGARAQNAVLRRGLAGAAAAVVRRAARRTVSFEDRIQPPLR